MRNKLLIFGLLCMLAGGVLSLIFNLANAMPVELNQFSHKQFSNISFYLNSTDGYIHAKGLVKNILPETLYGCSYCKGWIGFSIFFEDNATGATVRQAAGGVMGPIEPGATVPFDINTGYTPAQEYQFQYMKLALCC